MTFLKRERERRAIKREQRNKTDAKSNDYLIKNDKNKEELHDFNSNYTMKKLPATSLKKKLPEHAMWSIVPKNAYEIREFIKVNKQKTAKLLSPIQYKCPDQISKEKWDSLSVEKQKRFYQSSLNSYFYSEKIPGQPLHFGTFLQSEMEYLSISLSLIGNASNNWGWVSMLFPFRVGYQCAAAVRQEKIQKAMDCLTQLKTTPGKVHQILLEMTKLLQIAQIKPITIVDKQILQKIEQKINQAVNDKTIIYDSWLYKSAIKDEQLPEKIPNISTLDNLLSDDSNDSVGYNEDDSNSEYEPTDYDSDPDFVLEASDLSENDEPISEDELELFPAKSYPLD